MGIPVLAGQRFAAADFAPPASGGQRIVVNVALTHEFWPGLAPAAVLGKRLQLGAEKTSPRAEVIGVVGNTRDDRAISDGDRPQIYFAMDGFETHFELLLRSPLGAGDLSRALRPMLRQADAGLSLGAPMTAEASKALALAQPKFRAVLLGIFAGLAWVLALVGLYGVLAFAVRQRRREIGVRMALGASQGAVLRLILRQGVAVLAAGIGAGWVLSWILARYAASLLYGVGAFDAATRLGAGAALVAAGVMASLIPARRALRVDAAETLRCE